MYVVCSDISFLISVQMFNYPPKIWDCKTDEYNSIISYLIILCYIYTLNKNLVILEHVNQRKKTPFIYNKSLFLELLHKGDEIV